MLIETASRINPAPLNTPRLAFFVRARNTASSSKTAPRPAIPLTIVPVSSLPIFLMALANRFRDVARRISPAPLKRPILTFLVKPRNTANSSNTAPSPVIPLVMVFVSIPPSLATTSAKIFSEAARRTSPAPLNRPILAFLVNAMKIVSSSSTAPRPAMPLTSVSPSSLPMRSMTLAKTSMAEPRSISPVLAAANPAAFFSLILLRMKAKAVIAVSMIPMVSTASPSRSGSILATIYSAPAINAREAAILRTDFVMSFLDLKEPSVSAIPSEIPSIPPQIDSLMSVRLLIKFRIFRRTPPPSSAPRITAISAPSILVTKFLTLSPMLEKKVLILLRISLPSKNLLIFSPIPEK